MESNAALTSVRETQQLDRIAEPLTRAVRGAYDAAGSTGDRLKSALHGEGLGHPLHPVFTDVVIGAWTTAMALDAAGGSDPGLRRAATFAMGVGLVGAACAAVTGLTDWSETRGESRRQGLVHGLLNLTATSLMATAYAKRHNDSHDAGHMCAWTGYALAVGSAYLGGDLVFNRGIGVEPD